MTSIPESFQLCYSHDQIQEAVNRLGTDVSTWANQVWHASHTDLLAIPVLRGGIFFFADLVRRIEASVEISPAQSWAYELGENAVMREDVSVNIDSVPAKGRSLLLIDDICDSGKTLEALTAAFQEAGAIEVRSAVLIKRVLEKERFAPEWVGFDFEGPEWFVGYGMEDSGRWRNLPDIYTIQQRG